MQLLTGAATPVDAVTATLRPWAVKADTTAFSVKDLPTPAPPTKHQHIAITFESI